MKRLMNIKKNDLLFSKLGDFELKNGDLEDSTDILGLGFLEEVEIRVKSSTNDWYFEEDKGANLPDFEGRMINETLIEDIREAVTSSLTYDDFLASVDFSVDAKGIDLHEVAVKINFSDNIKKYIDYRIQDVRMVFDLRNGIPKIVRY
jgi:hypothetical protein